MLVPHFKNLKSSDKNSEVNLTSSDHSLCSFSLEMRIFVDGVLNIDYIALFFLLYFDGRLPWFKLLAVWIVDREFQEWPPALLSDSSFPNESVLTMWFLLAEFSKVG